MSASSNDSWIFCHRAATNRWFRLGCALVLLGVAACDPVVTPDMISAEPAAKGQQLASYSDRLPQDPDTVLAVVGDTQSRSPIGILKGAEVTESAQAQLFASLQQAHPDALVFLGDLGFRGMNQQAHRHFDRLFAPLTEKGQGVFPVLGNHDCYSREKCAPAFARRFAALRDETGAFRSYYAKRWGALLLVWLDSNQDQLTVQQWATQRRWFDQTLQRASDEDIAGILVFVHFPPYTNGQVTRVNSQTVKDAFLPAFCQSPLTLAMISGHTHGYQRFVLPCGSRPRQFIVSGGGGGSRHALLEPAKTGLVEPNPLPLGPPANARGPFEPKLVRPFNYLLLRQAEDRVLVTVRGLYEANEPVRELERFELCYPAGA